MEANWTDGGELFHHQSASVEKGLGADPHAISQNALAVEAAMQLRAVTDEHSVADFECFQVAK